MESKKKYKLLQDVIATIDGKEITTFIVSTMDYANNDYYLCAFIAYPVHEQNIKPI